MTQEELYSLIFAYGYNIFKYAVTATKNDDPHITATQLSKLLTDKERLTAALTAARQLELQFSLADKDVDNAKSKRAQKLDAEIAALRQVVEA